eukprot:jgi/Chrpa1/10544/Chrysochromulina_OHIO_Genome00005588-RA
MTAGGGNGRAVGNMARSASASPPHVSSHVSSSWSSTPQPTRCTSAQLGWRASTRRTPSAAAMSESSLASGSE